MSSRSKRLTALEARELISDHDNEIEENVSEDEDHLKVNSESDESDYEPNEETVIYIPLSKTFTSINGEIQWSSSSNKQTNITGGLKIFIMF